MIRPTLPDRPLLRRPMTARHPQEAHRVATPLELLFDLVSVIAIASAAAQLHHAVSANHAAEGALNFLMAFFAIWWAWMNYTWFASAYDNDDTLFRLLSLMAMGGSLTIAAGMEQLFEKHDLSLVATGYVIMRIAMIALWLRAARHDPERRQTALTYAAGIAILQVGWVGFVLLQPLPPTVVYVLFFVGVALELAVPVVAERKMTTPWHRHHIMERYGLLTIIVLGESLLAGALALRAGAAGGAVHGAAQGAAHGAAHGAGGGLDWELVGIALSVLLIVSAMWWMYFARQEHLDSSDLNRALLWGYGHFVIFAAGAATGAGFAVMVDVAGGKAKITESAGAWAVAVPLALFMAALWVVRDRRALTGAGRHMLPAGAAVILLAPLMPWPLEAIAVLAVVAVVGRNLLGQPRQVAEPA